MEELTDGQRKALKLDQNISVTAGAGAGKTRLLVERFLKIAVDHYRDNPQKVRRILAITFTNKAAGEMKERIAEAINRRIAESQDSGLRNHLLAIRDQLNSVAISTIHAFCTRVLREYPIEAGLAPDFSELDDMQSAMLMDEAIEQALEQLSDMDDQELLKRFWGLFEFWDRRTVVQMLRTALQHPYEMESILRRYSEFDRETFRDFLTGLWVSEMRSLLTDEELQYWKRIISAILQALPIPVPAELQEIVDYLQACAALPDKVDALSADDLQNLLNLSDRFTTGKNEPYSTLTSLGKKKNWPVYARDFVLELSSALSDWLMNNREFLPGKMPDAADWQAFEHLRTFLELYQQAADLYEQKKSEIPAVDFEDLLLKTYRLLSSNETVRRELSQRYEFIMVDEFQDTNALQWKIIEMLSSDDGQLSKEKVFIVGDPKQSIYGFRNADIRIFRQVKKTFAHAAGFKTTEAFPGNVILKESFRFVPTLNTFINDVFASVLNPSENNDYEVEFQPLIAKREASLESHIELALLDEEDALSEEDYIAATIAGLIGEKDGTLNEEAQKIQLGDIAILLRSRNNLLAIEQALRNYGIPFKTVKGIGYWQQQEIYDFYHLLCFLADPTDDFSLIGILRSKLFMIPDDVLYFLAKEEGASFWEKLNGKFEQGQYAKFDKTRLKTVRETLNRWIQMRNFLPLHELLNTVLDDLHYRALLASQINGEQLVANIEKFIEHVYRFNNSGILGLVDLIRQVELFIEQSLREGEPQINLEDKGTVKLMTIHAAKGLQFPVVFIPYLNTDNLKKGGGGSNVFIDAEIGLGASPRNDLLSGTRKPREKKRYALLELLKLQQKKKDLAEAKRIFYVGVTRASNHLFLSAKIKKDRTGREIIQSHSALQWLIAHYQNKNVDLFDPDLTQYEQSGYTLHIVRSLDKEEQAEQKISQWLNGIQQLQERVFRPEPADESTLYLYQPLHDTPAAITFSATRLMTYQKDAKEYYRRYHLGFFESDYELFADAVFKSDDSLIKGKLLHRFLQLLTEENAPDEHEILERVLFEYEVFDPQKQAQFREEILQLKAKISQSPIGQKIISASPARNEIPVTMRLGADYFTGTIDRIVLDADQNWHVIDYKTNRVKKGRVASAGQKYEEQMKGYALLLSRLLPQQEVFPVDLYFIYPDELYQRRYSKKDIEQIEQEFLRLIAEIKERFPVGK